MSLSKKIQHFTPPVYHEGKESYIDYYCFDPALGDMRRKKYKLNRIKTGRRKYAIAYIKRLNEQLSKGWNPWIEADSSASYFTLVEVFENFRSYILKMYSVGTYREETITAYMSFLRNIEAINSELKIPITYIYQFDRAFCTQILDVVFLDRNNSSYTYNNYLRFMSLFCSWCVNHGYLKINPASEMKGIPKRKQQKGRKMLSPTQVFELQQYLVNSNDKHYLLACYVLFYCFIRPKEMSHIKIGDISLKNQTIYIRDVHSKNGKNGTITLPSKVIKLMVELNIFSAANSDYLFSRNCCPGTEYRNEKIFRDKWLKIRKALGFSSDLKFYSLKDTGITEMLRHTDVLTVRDQARHSNVLMTDMYTPHDIQMANELIINYEGEF